MGSLKSITLKTEIRARIHCTKLELANMNLDFFFSPGEEVIVIDFYPENNPYVRIRKPLMQNALSILREWLIILDTHKSILSENT